MALFCHCNNCRLKEAPSLKMISTIQLDSWANHTKSAQWTTRVSKIQAKTLMNKTYSFIRFKVCTNNLFIKSHFPQLARSLQIMLTGPMLKEMLFLRREILGLKICLIIVARRMLWRHWLLTPTQILRPLWQVQTEQQIYLMRSIIWTRRYLSYRTACLIGIIDKIL